MSFRRKRGLLLMGVRHDPTESDTDRRSRFMRMAAEAARLGVGEKRSAFRDMFQHIAQSWLRLAGPETASGNGHSEKAVDASPEGG